MATFLVIIGLGLCVCFSCSVPLKTVVLRYANNNCRVYDNITTFSIHLLVGYYISGVLIGRAIVVYLIRDRPLVAKPKQQDGGKRLFCKCFGGNSQKKDIPRAKRLQNRV